MKGSAKLVMGATLILVVSLAIVLALILVLLAELYCSLLFRKRRYRTDTGTTATTTPAATSPQASLHSSTTSVQLSNVYAHGVFLAPRNILYPSIVHKQEEEICKKNQQKHQFFKPYDHQSHHHQVLEILNLDPNNTPSPFSSLTASPATMQQIHHQEAAESEITDVRVNIGSSVCGSAADKHLVYISNPIYDNELSYKHSGVGGGGGESGICSNATPFETPESSPSHLEMDWEEEEAEEDRRMKKGSLESSPNSSLETMTPPLTPMKKLLPMEASSSVSVSLRDARSIDTSGSSHGLSCSSSLSTSPSWCD